MPEEIVFITFTGILAGTIVVSQLIRTMGRYLDRKATRAEEPGALTAVEGELANLRGSVETLRQQVGEVEERVDFAERLIARERQPERLPRDGGAG
jgi:hypothetical protein